MVSIREILGFIQYKTILYGILFVILILSVLCFFVYNGYPITMLSFIVTPLLTISFIIIWDGYNSKKKENSLFLNLQLELSANLVSLTKNSVTIFKDLKAMPRGNHILSPLKILRTEIWDLIKFNTPNSLFKNNLIGKLATIYFVISELNENIESRENFRINNLITTNFVPGLKIYDKNIHNLIEILLGLFENLINSNDLKNELFEIEILKPQLDEAKSQNNKIKEILD